MINLALLLLPRMNIMLDFILYGFSRHVRSAWKAKKKTKLVRTSFKINVFPWFATNPFDRVTFNNFLQQEIWLVYMLDLHWVMWSFYFPHGKYICAIWWHAVPTNSGDSYGHLLCSTYSRLFSFLLRDGIMSNLQKSKRFDLIDKSNDTSRYLDDILFIDNPTFAEHIPDI